MKIIFILLLFCGSLFAQTSTEKWNDYNKRYEYFDSNGKMTAYKTYNTYLRQWETYNVNSNSGFEKTKIKSNFNAELADRVLAKEQKNYDDGVLLVKAKVNEIYARIASTFNSTDDHGFVKLVQDTYYNKVVVPLSNKGLDYSKRVNVDNALNYLENNYEWAIDQVFLEMEQRSKKK